MLLINGIKRWVLLFKESRVKRVLVGGQFWFSLQTVCADLVVGAIPGITAPSSERVLGVVIGAA